MDARNVVVTGLGVISPIGESVDEVTASLLGMRSGIRAWTSDSLKKVFPAGVVETRFDARFTGLDLPYLDRCSQMALLASDQAVAAAGLGDFAQFGDRAGVYYGTVRGGAATEEAWVRQFHMEGKQVSRPFTMLASMLNAGAAQISIRHHVLGPTMTHSSACASSGAAIGDALRAIRGGELDLAITGGAEASLIPSIFAAWDGIRALAMPDPDDVGRSCRPFSKHRRGLVVAEGAAFLVLESEAHARARGAPILCRVSGYGTASDAHHIGSPDSGGQVRAMRAALADAGLPAEAIGYLNAHATATAGGDPVEAQSIRTVFADGVRVSSTKSLHGHLLGGASAIELLVTIIGMREHFLPATAHLNDVAEDCVLRHVACRPETGIDIGHAMSFSAGFGGTNVALIVSRCPT
jgi:3-oxoacyl-(acyl-carrier-protein) synthase